MKNRAPAPCARCGETVAPGDGLVSGKDGDAWRVVHDRCIPTAPTTKRGGAVFGFDEKCRFLLERGDPGAERTAVWLMCNPSTATAYVDDPTIRRVRHFSARVNCPRVLVGNVWAWRATDPANLWAALLRGDYTDEMHRANLDMLTAIGAQADAVFVAFGAEPWRRWRPWVLQALEALLAGLDGSIVPDCLGMTADGAPLHPLARGKFAVRNDCQIFEWPGVLQL